MTCIITDNAASTTRTISKRHSIADTIYTAVVEHQMRKGGKVSPAGQYHDGLFMTDEYDTCCKSFCWPTPSHPDIERNHCLTLVHVAQVFQVTDYLDIARRADEIYEENGADACQAYLASGKITDEIMAIDLD